MSINLPQVNLNAAVVGTTFSVSLIDVGIPQDFVNSKLSSHVRFFNDSCIGLNGITQKSGKQFYIPQGGWPTIEIRSDETGFNFICTSQMLPVPSICFLQPVYYGPGEPLDDIGIHGNTPTNLGGNNVVNVTTLSNEGNAVGTEVIDIGTGANPKNIDIFNDHFIIYVEQGGVRHKVLEGKISGNQLIIGAAGDTTEIDSDLVSIGNVTMIGGKTLSFTNGLGGGFLADIGCDSGGVISYVSSGSTHKFFTVGNVLVATINANGLLMNSTNVDLGSGGSFKYRNANTEHNLSTSVQSVTGTVNHNLGETPFDAYITTDVSGSQTVGYDSLTSTTAHVTLFSSLHTRAIWRV